jgi:hypothetical protein
VLINNASIGSVFGGRSFAPQPRAEVRDADRNVLIDGSSSAIRVSIYSNPLQTTIANQRDRWNSTEGSSTPFPTQPKLALVDAGGNIVDRESSLMVTAHVTPSMAHNSMVIINTSVTKVGLREVLKMTMERFMAQAVLFKSM